MTGTVRHRLLMRLRVDRGAISVMFAVLAVALLAAVAIVVDGGRKLGALADARNIADNAARAGAQEVDVETFRNTGDPVIDLAAAQSAIATFMGSSGFSGRVDSWSATLGADPTTIDVTVTITPNTFMIPLPPASATETAQAVASVAG